jgi:hypothetical protein
MALSKRAKDGGLLPMLLSVLRHLLLIPVDGENGIRTWVLAERLVQQVALQKEIIAIDDTYRALHSM